MKIKAFFPRVPKPHAATTSYLLTPPATPSSTRQTAEETLEVPNSPASLDESLSASPRAASAPGRDPVPGPSTPLAKPASITSLAPKRSRSTVSRSTVGRVSVIIGVIKKIRDERQEPNQGGGGYFRKWSLDPYEYDYLIERLSNTPGLPEYFEDKLRYEYSASSQEFSIFMPGDFHSTFASELHSTLVEELMLIKLANAESRYQEISSELRDAAKDITRTGDRKLKLRNKENKEPDASFVCDCPHCRQEKKKQREKRHPTILFEVNWAHLTSDQLAQRAQDFINLSQGKIRTIVNFDMRAIYDKFKSKKSWDEIRAAARVSIWRARAEDADGQEVIVPVKEYDEAFRDVGGSPVGSVKLALHLSDFFCRERVAALPDSETLDIEFTAEQLCKMFNKALDIMLDEYEAARAPVTPQGEASEIDRPVTAEAPVAGTETSHMDADGDASPPQDSPPGPRRSKRIKLREMKERMSSKLPGKSRSRKS